MPKLTDEKIAELWAALALPVRKRAARIMDALPDLLSDLEEARRQRDEALARPIYQCTNCGVIRFNKFEACVCGAAAQQLPRDLFKQLIEHLRSVQQELDADFTGR